MIVDDCIFENNAAANAACIGSSGAAVSISNSVMRSNTADGFGAVMLLIDKKLSRLSSITNTTFARNAASIGGAVYSELDGKGLLISQVSTSCVLA
jgi:hypothetical protein